MSVLDVSQVSHDLIKASVLELTGEDQRSRWRPWLGRKQTQSLHHLEAHWPCRGICSRLGQWRLVTTSHSPI